MSDQIPFSTLPFPLTLRARLTQFDARRETLHSVSTSLDVAAGDAKVELAGASWTLRWRMRLIDDRPGTVDVMLEAQIDAGRSERTSMSVDLTPPDWGTDRYVVLPGAVYGGNRFDVRPQGYPPMFDPADARPDVPVLITDVARLNVQPGEPSRLQLPSHDLATPALGVFDPTRQAGLWLLTGQRTRVGPYGFEINESPDRSRAVLSVNAPCVRAGRRAWATWSDPVPDWEAGTAASTLMWRVRVHSFNCASLPAFFERFAAVRKEYVPSEPRFDCAPFSACQPILHLKQNRTHWHEAPGFYGDVTADGRPGWQLGWVGSLVGSFPLLAAGDELSVTRAVRTLDWAVTTQTDCGLLRAMYKDGRWVGDGFGKPGTERFAMVRKEADALYFGLKHLAWLQHTGRGEQVKPAWRDMFERLADALALLWRRDGQFGQFLDDQTGQIAVGNSTAGALAIGAIAVAGQFFGRPDLIETARDAGNAYHDRWTARGITTGGPGEILACPDSESAMGLVESFVALHEVTGDRHWLTFAAHAADQLASWVVSYDFEFPPESDLGRLRARATGTVIANSQNKHSAPGLCTFSGDALLKLFRATGEGRHLELLRDIAATLPQYMSRADRVVGTGDPGLICERVNLSDWEGDHRVGHVPPWSCWCEAALMLTCLEVPGVYVQPDTAYVLALDNIEARLVGRDLATQAVIVELCNNTPLDAAAINVMVETRDAASAEALGMAWQPKHFAPVAVPAGGVRWIRCSAAGGCHPVEMNALLQPLT
jgi:hypothetical protein